MYVLSKFYNEANGQSMDSVHFSRKHGTSEECPLSLIETEIDLLCEKERRNFANDGPELGSFYEPCFNIS